MGKPCGCGGAALTIRCEDGMTCSGLGTSTDPLVIKWQIPLATVACNAVMDCVGTHLGDGFIFDSGTKTLRIKIDPAAENLATVGPQGLLVAGTPPQGGGGVSVAGMLTLPKPVIGSAYGAGFAIVPEGQRESYTAAANLLGLVSLVHVPVRRSVEALPVCLHYDTMASYNTAIVDRVIDMDASMLSRCSIEPGGPTETYLSGYFGYGAKKSTGAPLLSDVLDVLGNRAVVYLEVKDTNSPRTTADRIKEQMSVYGISKSLIVAGEPLAATGSDATILHGVIASFAGSGVPIAAHLTSAAQVSAYPAATLVSLGCTWVALSYAIADPASPSYVAGAVTAYKAAGLQVLLFGVHRQYQYDLAVTNDVRGVISFDPVYAAGAKTAYRYRQDNSTWSWGTPDYGRQSSWSDTIPGQRDYYRGYVRDGQPDQIVLDQALRNPGSPVDNEQSGYWLSLGELGPYRNANTYAVQFWVLWTAIPAPGSGRWAGMWLDRPTDHPLMDFGRSTSQTIGYLFSLSQAGTFVLSEYVGNASVGGAPPAGLVTHFVGASGYSVVPNEFYGLRAEVTPTAIRLYRTTPITTTPFAKTLIYTLNNPTRYISGTNKGHPFLGRHFFNSGEARETRFGWASVLYSF